MQLSEAKARFDALGVRLAAINYEDQATNKKFAVQSDITFPLLTDVDARHVKAFGILNDQYEPGHRWYGIPYPGIFIVDANGTVFAKLAEEDYSKRPPVEVVLETVAAMLDRGDP